MTADAAQTQPAPGEPPAANVAAPEKIRPGKSRFRRQRQPQAELTASPLPASEPMDPGFAQAAKLQIDATSAHTPFGPVPLPPQRPAEIAAEPQLESAPALRGTETPPAPAALGFAATPAGASVTNAVPAGSPAVEAAQTSTPAAEAEPVGQAPVTLAALPPPRPEEIAVAAVEPAPAAARAPLPALFSGQTVIAKQQPTALAMLPAAPMPTPRSSVDTLISEHAARYNVPESLVRRVVARESRFNPRARNGPFFGLMQIRVATARGMGYHGGGEGLLDAETNLTYGVPYLANALRVAGGNHDQAVRLYASGYYYEAKRKGLLRQMVKAQ